MPQSDTVTFFAQNLWNFVSFILFYLGFLMNLILYYFLKVTKIFKDIQHVFNVQTNCFFKYSDIILKSTMTTKGLKLLGFIN